MCKGHENTDKCACVLAALCFWVQAHRSPTFHMGSRQWLPGSEHAASCRAACLYGQNPPSYWSSPGVGCPGTLWSRSQTAQTSAAPPALRTHRIEYVLNFTFLLKALSARSVFGAAQDVSGPGDPNSHACSGSSKTQESSRDNILRSHQCWTWRRWLPQRLASPLLGRLLHSPFWWRSHPPVVLPSSTLCDVTPRCACLPWVACASRERA